MQYYIIYKDHSCITDFLSIAEYCDLRMAPSFDFFQLHLIVPTLLFLLLNEVTSSCRYPDYMYGTAFPWMVRSSAGPAWQKKGYQEVAFHGDHARIKHTKSREPEHIVEFSTYRCVLGIDAETVIVQVETEGSDVVGNYTCVQFVKRTINVVQWKLGDESTVIDRSICDNSTLVLQAAPLVYYPHSSGFWNEERNDALEYEPCPAVGGYIIRQWYNETGTPLFDFTKVIPMKLENECATGAGIKLIEVGSRKPWPTLPMEYFCMASWEDENFLYMVLWFTGINYYVPCFRLPLSRGNRFHAHFFLDGACDTGTNSIEQSVSYGSWLMEHKPSPGMCTDDAPMCRTPVVNCSRESHLCRESCRACPEDEEYQRHWENVQFPERFQGTWQKHSFDLDTEVVIVNENTLEIPSLGSFTNVGLSQCTKTSYRRTGLPYNAEEFSLLTFFENGCSPHGTSIIMGNWSTSVISFRITISKPIIKPLLTTFNSHYDKWIIRDSFESLCDNLGLYFYETDPEPIGTKYRVFPNGWFNMIRLDEPLELVPCYFPINFATFKIRLSSGTECQVRVESTDDSIQEPLNIRTAAVSTSFNLVLETCTPGYDVEESSPGNSHEHNTTTETPVLTAALIDEQLPVVDEVRTYKTDSHGCLASFHDKFHNKYIITRVTSQEPLVGQEYLCWLFSSRTGRAYWFPISSCDSNTERHLGRTDYVPYAVIDSSPVLHCHGVLQLIVPLLTVIICHYQLCLL